MSKHISNETIKDLKNVVVLKSYVWRKNDGTEVSMMDASLDELTKWREHIYSMLYSHSPKVGKQELMQKITEQILLCKTELFLRNLAEDPKTQFPRYKLQGLLLSQLSASSLEESDSIRAIFDNLDSSYNQMTIKHILNACDNTTPKFSKLYNPKMLLKMGIRLKNSDCNELGIKVEASKEEKLKRIKEILKIKDPDNILKIKHSGLSYPEFKSVWNIQYVKYNSLTTLTLKTLSQEVLMRYARTVIQQMKFWNKKLEEIDKVINYKKENA